MKFSRLISALICGLLASVNIAFAQGVPGVTSTEIKIGVHLSLSGPASFFRARSAGGNFSTGIDLKAFLQGGSTLVEGRGGSYGLC